VGGHLAALPAVYVGMNRAAACVAISLLESRSWLKVPCSDGGPTSKAAQAQDCFSGTQTALSLETAPSSRQESQSEVARNKDMVSRRRTSAPPFVVARDGSLLVTQRTLRMRQPEQSEGASGALSSHCSTSS
jgi:hypothetical protein